MSTTEARAQYSAILQALADLVSLPQTDQQREDDVVPRDPVLQRVLSIRGAADGLISAALAAAAPSPVAIPEGWRLVPVEATPQMLDAAATASMQHLLDCIADPKKARDIGSEENVRLTHASRYRKMIASAPTAQPQPQPERYVSALDPALQAIGKTWSAHGRDDGMRVPEASDLAGGSTDATAQPEAPTVPSDRENDPLFVAGRLEDWAGSFAARGPLTQWLLKGAALLRRLATPAPVAAAEPSDKPLGYVKFRAAQTLQTDGYCDGHEWLEFCEPGELGDDKKPAFAVYASPQAAPAAQQSAELTDAQIDMIARDFGLWNIRRAVRGIVRTVIKAQGGDQ